MRVRPVSDASVMVVLQEGHVCHFLFTWFSAYGLAVSLWRLGFRV